MSLIYLLIRLESIISAVLTTRIILNIREIAAETTVELHTQNRRVLSDESTACQDNAMMLSTVFNGDVGTLDRSLYV